MVCRCCGYIYQDDLSFCPNCGIAKNDTSDRGKKPTKCEACGNVLLPDDKFCDNCGAKIKKINSDDELMNIECPKCHTSFPNFQKNCPFCGAKNNDYVNPKNVKKKYQDLNQDKHSAIEVIADILDIFLD